MSDYDPFKTFNEYALL